MDQFPYERNEATPPAASMRGMLLTTLFGETSWGGVVGRAQGNKEAEVAILEAVANIFALEMRHGGQEDKLAVIEHCLAGADTDEMAQFFGYDTIYDDNAAHHVADLTGDIVRDLTPAVTWMHERYRGAPTVKGVVTSMQRYAAELFESWQYPNDEHHVAAHDVASAVLGDDARGIGHFVAHVSNQPNALFAHMPGRSLEKVLKMIRRIYAEGEEKEVSAGMWFLLEMAGSPEKGLPPKTFREIAEQVELGEEHIDDLVAELKEMADRIEVYRRNERQAQLGRRATPEVVNVAVAAEPELAAPASRETQLLPEEEVETEIVPQVDLDEPQFAPIREFLQTDPLGILLAQARGIGQPRRAISALAGDAGISDNMTRQRINQAELALQRIVKELGITLGQKGIAALWSGGEAVMRHMEEYPWSDARILSELPSGLRERLSSLAATDRDMYQHLVAATFETIPYRQAWAMRRRSVAGFEIDRPTLASIAKDAGQAKTAIIGQIKMGWRGFSANATHLLDGNPKAIELGMGLGRVYSPLVFFIDIDVSPPIAVTPSERREQALQLVGSSFLDGQTQELLTRAYGLNGDPPEGTDTLSLFIDRPRAIVVQRINKAIKLLAMLYGGDDDE